MKQRKKFIMHLKNQQCPVCRQDFNAADEIVVCPECGTAYHRACYQKVQHCLYEDLHQKIKEDERQEIWKKRFDEVNQQQTISQQKCPYCQTLNDQSNLFCTGCGQKLSKNSESSDAGNGKKETLFDAFAVSSVLRENVGDKELQGIAREDFASYIGQNFPYYYPRFCMFHKKHCLSLNLSALLFAPIFLVYRKMYGMGIIYILLHMLSVFGEAALYVYGIGVNMPAYLYSFTLIISLLNFLLSIFCGFFFNYLYYRKARKKIIKIKSASSSDSYKDKLQNAGGINWVAASIIILLFGCGACILTYVTAIWR